MSPPNIITYLGRPITDLTRDELLEALTIAVGDAESARNSIRSILKVQEAVRQAQRRLA